MPKGHVIYEGKKGHVLSYDGKSQPLAFLGQVLEGCAVCWESGAVWGKAMK